MSQEQKPSGATPQQKRLLRNFLINKRLQLRYTIVSMLVTVGLCACLGTVVIWQNRQATSFFITQHKKTTELFRKQRQERRKLIKGIREVARKDLKKVLKTTRDMLDLQLKDKDPDVREAAKIAKMEFAQHDKARLKRQKEADQALLTKRKKDDLQLLRQRKHQDRLDANRRQGQEMLIVIVLIAFCAIVAVVIFFFNITLTHKIAGPLFKMGRYLDEVAAGRLPMVYNIRKGDQLQDFFARFRAAYDAIVRRTEEDIVVLEDALKRIEDNRENEGLRTSLENLIHQKRTSLPGQHEQDND